MDPNGMACTVCGGRVSGDRIRVFARREDLAFVEVACSACGSATPAMILGESGSAACASDAAARESASAAVAAIPAGPAPIGADDVLDMHAFLASWDGDLEGLLGSGSASEGPVGSSR